MAGRGRAPSRGRRFAGASDLEGWSRRGASFESVEVLGLNTMHVEPTPAALRRGLAEAFRADELGMVGARGVEPTNHAGSWCEVTCQ